MKIVNNRAVCSGCEQGFEVGQKMIGRLTQPALITGFVMTEFGSYPTTTAREAKDKEELFHEGCD